MTWQTLLAKIGVCDPPLPELPALLRESSTRAGVVSRRAFLQIAGASVAALAIDPERLLWTPGEKTILEAKTMVEALDMAIAAYFPDGSMLSRRFDGGPRSFKAESVEVQIVRHIREVEAAGGRVVTQGPYTREVYGGRKLSDVVEQRQARSGAPVIRGKPYPRNPGGAVWQPK